MFYEMLLHAAQGNQSLDVILNDFQPNLSSHKESIGEFTLVTCINGESEYVNLIDSLQANGFDPLILVESNPGGSDEVLYPFEYSPDTTDVAAASLHWFRQQLVDRARKAKQDQQRQRSTKWKRGVRLKAGNK